MYTETSTFCCNVARYHMFFMTNAKCFMIPTRLPKLDCSCSWGWYAGSVTSKAPKKNQWYSFCLPGCSPDQTTLWKWLFKSNQTRYILLTVPHWQQVWWSSLSVQNGQNLERQDQFLAHTVLNICSFQLLLCRVFCRIVSYEIQTQAILCWLSINFLLLCLSALLLLLSSSPHL